MCRHIHTLIIDIKQCPIYTPQVFSEWKWLSHCLCENSDSREREEKKKKTLTWASSNFISSWNKKIVIHLTRFPFFSFHFLLIFLLSDRVPFFFSLLSKQLSIFMMSIGHVKTQDFSHLTLHIGDESKNVINLKRKKFFFKMISSNSLNIFAARWTWKCDDTVKMPYNS